MTLDPNTKHSAATRLRDVFAVVDQMKDAAELSARQRWKVDKLTGVFECGPISRGELDTFRVPLEYNFDEVQR